MPKAHLNLLLFPRKTHYYPLAVVNKYLYIKIYLSQKTHLYFLLNKYVVEEELFVFGGYYNTKQEVGFNIVIYIITKLF